MAAAGQVVEGSAGLVGRIEHRLDGVELCVEIVPGGGRAGDEPGVAVLDRRETPTAAGAGLRGPWGRRGRASVILDVEDATG